MLRNANALGYHGRPLAPLSWRSLAARYEQVVYKVLPAAERSGSPVSATRTIVYNLEFLPNCSVYARGQQRVIIAYSFIPGNHTPSTIGHCLALIDKLRSLHQSKNRRLVHGDVRLCNAVFHENHAASFIDFDLCAPEGSLYAPNYNSDIADGARAPGACADFPMTQHHDWFGLSAAFSLFVPEQTHLLAAWETALRLLQEGDHVAAIPLLISHSEERLSRNAASVHVNIDCWMKPSGSPPGSPPDKIGPEQERALHGQLQHLSLGSSGNNSISEADESAPEIPATPTASPVPQSRRPSAAGVIIARLARSPLGRILRARR